MLRNRRSRRRGLLLESKARPSGNARRWRTRLWRWGGNIFVLRSIAKLFRVSLVLNLVFAAMALFVGFALFSPYFHVKHIRVLRDDPNIDTEKIEQTLKDFYDKNLLFFPNTRAERILQETFPEFRTIDFSPDFPDTLVLSIELSPPKAILLNVTTANFVVVSEDGVTLEHNSQAELPIIKVYQYEKSLPLQTRFFAPTELQHIFTARDFLEQSVGIPVQEMHYYWAAQELHLVTERGVIWVDLMAEDTENQLQKLLYAQDKMGLFIHQFDHIDVRIPKRIFWEVLP